MGVRAGVAWAAGAVYLVSAAACSARSSAQFADIGVYRMGGGAVLHGGSLYRLKAGALPFTYPPFAAVVLTVLAAIPRDGAVALLTAASAVALPVMLYLVLRLPGPGGRAGPAARPGRLAWTVALSVAAAVIWLDPARATLGYGQVDIVLAAALLYDLALPGTCRWKGVAIGLAAGFKLTPAIFAVYLLLTRRYRAAATAAAVACTGGGGGGHRACAGGRRQPQRR